MVRLSGQNTKANQQVQHAGSTLGQRQRRWPNVEPACCIGWEETGLSTQAAPRQRHLYICSAGVHISPELGRRILVRAVDSLDQHPDITAASSAN